jgi:spermidine synthase
VISCAYSSDGTVASVDIEARVIRWIRQRLQHCSTGDSTRKRPLIYQ